MTARASAGVVNFIMELVGQRTAGLGTGRLLPGRPLEDLSPAATFAGDGRSIGSRDGSERTMGTRTGGEMAKGEFLGFHTRTFHG